MILEYYEDDLKMILESYEDIKKPEEIHFPKDELGYKAFQMAITALELQDGNLYLRDVPGSLSIGIVKGTVYMGGYEEE